jgi:hypothetical protein
LEEIRELLDDPNPLITRSLGTKRVYLFTNR